MKRTLRLMLGLIVSIGLLAESYAQTGLPRPNIVLIFVDDMGYGDLIANLPPGTVPDYETPYLDTLAQEGMRFTHFYSASAVCTPARAALLTGSYPPRVGLPRVLRPNAEIGLNLDETTLAELVKQEGYSTGMFGKWHLGDPPELWPTNHGFDRFLGLPYSNDQWPRDRFGNLVTSGNKVNNPELPLIRDNTIVDEITSLEKQDSLTYKYTIEAVDFINTEATAGNSFFAYVPHSMPHVPLAVRDEFKTTLADRYKDVMEELDWSVGQILQALEANGVENNTWVIFTSDNGPWLRYGNHGGSSGPFREGKTTAFEGGFRVPCLMKWPGVIPAGTVNARVASTIDIFPTVAAATGASLPNPATHPIDGVDITPLMENGFAGGKIRGEFAYYRREELAAVRAGIWKYVFPYTYDTVAVAGINGTFGQSNSVFFPGALYNLVQDPGETTDLQAGNPAKVAELKAIADGIAQKLGNIGGADEPFRDRDIPRYEGTENRPPATAAPGPTFPTVQKNDVFYQTGSTVKIEQMIGDLDKSRNEPTQNQTESRFGLGFTDLGVPFQFEDSDTTFIFYGDDFVSGGDPIAITTDMNPEDGLALDFLTNPDGTYKQLEIAGIDLGGFGVPLDGVTSNGNIYLYTAQVLEGTSQLSISTDKGHTFTKLYDFSSDRFNNISVFETTSNEAYPEPIGTEIQVMLGSGTYRRSNAFMAYQPINSIEDKSTVRYFTGVDQNGAPKWSSLESEAIDLFNQRCVGELNVAYNEFIDKWILLYNCGNSPGPRGINARTAENPWGPWSEPFVIFNPRDDNGYCNFMHSNWLVEVCDSIHDAGRENVWGGSYGPYQFDQLATGNDLETTIYYTLSTWNPYTTLLMKSTMVKDTATNVLASGVSINFDQATLELNQQRLLRSTVFPKNAADRSVVWSTSDASIATVNADGFIRGISEGTAVITATTHNGFSDSTLVTVSRRPQVAAVLPSGLYTLRAQHSNRALDNNGFPVNSDDRNVVQFDFNDLGFQKWQLDTLDGGYYRLTNWISGEVLNLVNCNNANGANVNQQVWANTDCQKWQIAQLPDGNYRLISKASGKSLEVNGTNNNGSNVQQWVWLGFNHQRWDIQPTAVVNVTGVTINSGNLQLELGQNIRLIRSVTPSNASIRSVTWSSSDTTVAKVNENGFVTTVGVGAAKITVTTDDGNFSDMSNITVIPFPALSRPIQDGVYTLSALYSNRFMDNRGFPDESVSRNIVEKDFSGGDSQTWRIEAVDGSYYKIVSLKSNEVLTLQDSSALDRGNVIQAQWIDSDLQKWQIVNLGMGTYRIVSKFSKKTLEGDGTNFTGSNVRQFTWLDLDNQKWKIEQQPLAKLNLTSMCSDEPSVERRWRIRNPNRFGVEVWWHVYGTSQRDTLVAPPGDSFFFTQTVGGANTTKLFYRKIDGSIKAVTKASGGAQCATASRAVAEETISEEVPVTGLVIYPNPWSEDGLMVEADGVIEEISVYNLAGSLLYQSSPKQNTIQLSRSIFSERGLLMIKVITDKNESVTKVVLK